MKSLFLALPVIVFCLTMGSVFAADQNLPLSGPLSGASLYESVLKYSEFGDHQTGHPGDIATSKWIAEELKKAGLKAELKPWKLNQFFLKNCELKVGAHRIESFPGWFPNSNPVTGRLAVLDPSNTGNLKGHIAFAGLKYGGVSNTGLIKLVEGPGGRGRRSYRGRQEFRRFRIVDRGQCRAKRTGAGISSDPLASADGDRRR